MIPENSLTPLRSLHSDLLIVKELLYDKCGFDFTIPNVEVESIEYGACTFLLNGNFIKHRVSKITPTKTGQFVTIWKRNISGVTEPFDASDDIDFLIITSRKGNNIGQFIFPKTVLIDKGIVSINNKSGKRGIRVYPPWDKATSKQAQQTQRWQTSYFLEVTGGNSVEDIARLSTFHQLLK
jgi:hypothetical protein